MRVVLLLLAVLAAGALGLAVGGAPLSLDDVWSGLLDREGRVGQIVWELRMPRVVLSFLVGGALGISGAALQAMIRNPLAEPYLLGVTGGAGLGAVLAIVLGLTASWALPAAALVGALASSVLVYLVAAVQGSRLEPRVLVLVGVVFSAFAGALMSSMLALSEAQALRNAFLWLLGGFGNSSWPQVVTFLCYAVPPILVVFVLARALDLLSLGDDAAHALGVSTAATRRWVYLATALLTAASVAVSGMIGFVGLVAPHAMRGWVGPLHRRLLPAVFLASGGLLVLADALARTAVRPAELPVGAVTAMIGVPLFAVLLRRSIA